MRLVVGAAFLALSSTQVLAAAQVAPQQPLNLTCMGGGTANKPTAMTAHTNAYGSGMVGTTPVSGSGYGDTTVFCLDRPKALDARELEHLYRGASGECPVIKAPEAPPCASGRFGCWTCTVVRKDKSSLSLIEAGHHELIPYFEFRKWLAEIRNDPERRWKRRRNGAAGAGAFNMRARKEILDQVRQLERLTGTTIINADEHREIERLWAVDASNDLSMNA